MSKGLLVTSREVKNYTAIKLPVIPFCPITGNQPMRCLKSGFEVSCKKFQALEQNRYEKISTRSDHLTRYCDICRGDNIPANVTFIDLPTTTTQKKKGENMPASKYTPGTCDSCGGAKRVTAHLGKNVCSSCISFRCSCKNAPELVLAALKEFGHLPERAIYVVEDSGPCQHCQEVDELNTALRHKLDDVTAIKDGFTQTIQKLEERVLTVCTEIEVHKKEIADLERVEEILKEELRAAHTDNTAPGLDVAKKTAINFLAWKLADGLLTGDITGIGVSDIRTIRGLAE